MDSAAATGGVVPPEAPETPSAMDAGDTLGVGVADATSGRRSSGNEANLATGMRGLAMPSSEEAEDPTVAPDGSRALENLRRLRKISELYDVKEELGKGAFSIVHKGVHRGSGLEVAIKVIQLSCLSEAERERQERILENEIKIMQRIISHCEDTTNLIEIKDVVREESRLAIVMEILRGKELFDRIVARQRYTEQDAAFLMNKIIKAVRTLHRAQIIHRDLKPENLVFAGDEEEAEIKITDFGLSLNKEGRDVHSSVVGTPNYVAPEVVAIKPRGPFYSEQCDMWSCGVILYILLVGYPPFYHEDVKQLFRQIRAGKYEFHFEQWKHCSNEAKDLVSKMLVVDPRRRLTTDQVLAHPWMRNAPNSELNSTIVEMKKTRARAKFKAAAFAVRWGAVLGLRRKLLTLVDSTDARVFNLDELQRIRASFSLHATDNKLDKIQFEQALRRLGFQNVPIDRMFELFDKNGDGTIDYKELLGALAVLRESGEAALAFCFRIFDENDTGHISKADVGKVLSITLRKDSSALTEKLEQIFADIDRNGDDLISYEEFKAGIFISPELVQAFLQPMDDIADLPEENFMLDEIERGYIDSSYLQD